MVALERAAAENVLQPTKSKGRGVWEGHHSAGPLGGEVEGRRLSLRWQLHSGGRRVHLPAGQAWYDQTARAGVEEQAQAGQLVGQDGFETIF